MKTLLLENGGIATSETLEWVKSIDPNYKEIDTEIRNYQDSDDLRFFGLLTLPTLEQIVTSSAFEWPLDNRLVEKLKHTDDLEVMENSYQIEYFSYLLFYAGRFREQFGYKPLTIHINYLYHDFVKAVRKERLGSLTTDHLKLILRQQEGVVFKIYNEYKLKTTLLKEEDLGL